MKSIICTTCKQPNNGANPRCFNCGVPLSDEWALSSRAIRQGVLIVLVVAVLWSLLIAWGKQ